MEAVWATRFPKMWDVHFEKGNDMGNNMKWDGDATWLLLDNNMMLDGIKFFFFFLFLNSYPLNIFISSKIIKKKIWMPWKAQASQKSIHYSDATFKWRKHPQSGILQ